VTGPDNVSVPLARLPGETIGVLRTPGLYVAEGGGSRTTFAVSVSDPDVSNLTKSGATATNTPSFAYGGGRRPWWLYCGAVALALALAEWWTWLRRITV
jgi:hypothetical protein